MDELLELEKRDINLNEIKSANWISILHADDETQVNSLLKELDLGEAEAISLAVQLHADWLLIDETKGRKIAQAEGLTIVGLLGVLLQAKEKELIPSLKDVLDQIMLSAKFRVANDLYLRVLELANEHV